LGEIGVLDAGVLDAGVLGLAVGRRRAIKKIKSRFDHFETALL